MNKIIDGFVKNPSAALGCTPALLDQKIRIEGMGLGSNFQEEDSSWGLSNRVNRCGIPVSPLQSSSFARLASGAFFRNHSCDDFLRDHQIYIFRRQPSTEEFREKLTSNHSFSADPLFEERTVQDRPGYLAVLHF